MGITLYTAPDCIRCKIVKAFLHDKGTAYDTVDFKEQKQEFNAFYRANRPSIYRNEEGVEFPIFSDGSVIKQGSGEIIAYLLSGHAMEGCVTRSDLLHGWISGLYPSLCPGGLEDAFAELTDRLAKGGLRVFLQADGRKPGLLKRLLSGVAVAKVHLNVLGPASAYASDSGGPLDPADLAESVALVRDFGGQIRLLCRPLERANGEWSWTAKDEMAEAAKMLAEATGDKLLPVTVDALDESSPQGLHGLTPFDKAQLLPYRSACRKFLFKADIAKPDTP